MKNKSMLRYAHSSLLSNRVSFVLDCRARYELLMLDVIVGRLKTYGYLDEEDFKKMITLIWEFLVERGMARSMPEF